MTVQARVVEIEVSAPYQLIAGGYTGLRPVGMRRDYMASVDGREYRNTSKATIQQVIRRRLYPARVKFRFIDRQSGRLL